MSVMRFDPFVDPFRQMDRLTNQLLSGTRTPMGMPMDVWQAEDGYHVALDMPGVDPGTVEITSERNLLTIRAERRTEVGQEARVLIAERPQGSFTRQLQVGEAMDTQNITASYSNGVLSLTIPVAQAAQPRRIQVQHTSGGQQIDLSGQQQGEVQAGQTADQGQIAGQGQTAGQGQAGEATGAEEPVAASSGAEGAGRTS